MDSIDVVRCAVGLLILGYAAYRDVKTREASNRLWLIMGGCGAVLLVVERPDILLTAVSIGVTVPFALLLYVFGMGGADVKAMWALAVLVPLPPDVGSFPLVEVIIPVFPFVILLNSLLLIVALPVVYLAYNIRQGTCLFPYCLFGYKMRASTAKNAFFWSMEDDSGPRITPAKDMDIARFGDREIWVTPQLPFLVFIAIGFAIAFFYGDILFGILSFFLQ
jgi:preflagellin peptidase FlaK